MTTTDKLRTVNIGDIKVPAGRRATDPKTIEKLVELIATVGLLNPILVRAADVGDTSNRMILVAGRHRLEALKMLGRQRVQCALLADDDLRAELAEIDENSMPGRTDARSERGGDLSAEENLHRAAPGHRRRQGAGHGYEREAW